MSKFNVSLGARKPTADKFQVTQIATSVGNFVQRVYAANKPVHQAASAPVYAQMLCKLM